MPKTHARKLVTAAASMAAALAATGAAAQGQAPPPMIREYCVKVAPGKGAEYAALLRDVMVPLNQSRADAGEFSWYAVVRSVVPAGTSAPCDYRLAYGYKGLPPEEASTEAIDAALKRAKMTLTGEQLAARRGALTTLVAVEIWGEIDGIGAPPQKNAYVRFNRYRTKSGEFEEWVRLERATWKPVMDAWLKAGGKGSWSLNVLGAPGGESTPYNGMTVDIFPDWNGLMQGVPADELWPKVHPGTTTTDTFNRFDRSRSIHSIEIGKIVEVVRGK
jgi:hypothetical protein